MLDGPIAAADVHQGAGDGSHHVVQEPVGFHVDPKVVAESADGRKVFEFQRGPLFTNILLADEITGELDSVTATTVLAAVTTVHRATGTTVVLVTHDPAVAAISDRIVVLRDGRVESDRRLT